MDFLFFKADNTRLFTRGDAETAVWTAHEMTLALTFPYDEKKVIERGQRIAFNDPAGGGYQFFEIRKVRNLEPDHYQEVNAESIVISELADCHVPAFDALTQTAREVLTTILNGTGWSIGTIDIGDVAEQNRIRAACVALGLNGHVSIPDQPIVQKDQMQNAGYTDFADATTNLSPILYKWTEPGEEEGEETVVATILMTPIRADGTIYGPDRMGSYMATMYATAETYSGLLGADTDNMVIHVLQGDQESAMETISASASALADEWVDTIYDEQSSAQFSMSSAWQDICTVRDNWNVTITPRITFNATGITGKLLDVSRNVPVWRGVRLSINKNADEMGVTYDDTELFTAFYGYGATRQDKKSDEKSEGITFENEVWEATADHPAKPRGQKYIEDPQATALYGRNGRPRFGFYQNGDIKSTEILLEKTWESLKNQKEPTVTVECMVRDLYRLGYADQPLRLNDEAIIDIEPIGAQLKRTVIQMEVDLIDPTATRVTIGNYIPNIIYINRETASRSGGGGGGGGSGGTGMSRDSDSETQFDRTEFESDIQANNYQISLRAYQNDMDIVNKQLRQAEINITAQGVRISAAEGTIIEHDTTLAEHQAEIDVNAQQIALKVSKGEVSTQLAVECGNVSITGGNLTVDGYIKSAELSTEIAAINVVTVKSLKCEVGASFPDSNVYFGQLAVASIPNAVASFGTTSSSGGQISIPYTRLSGGTGTINFNIADTQFYQDGVAAAKLEGWNAACALVTRSNNTIYAPVANSYGVNEQKYQANYHASTYVASSHSFLNGYMMYNSRVYTTNQDIQASNYSGAIQFRQATDSYTASTYTASSLTWTNY